MALGHPAAGFSTVHQSTGRSPTRTPPPPNPNDYSPMDHLLFGAALCGGTQPSQSRWSPEPSGSRAEVAARANSRQMMSREESFVNTRNRAAHKTQSRPDSRSGGRFGGGQSPPARARFGSVAAGS